MDAVDAREGVREGGAGAGAHLAAEVEVLAVLLAREAAAARPVERRLEEDEGAAVPRARDGCGGADVARLEQREDVQPLRVRRRVSRRPCEHLHHAVVSHPYRK